MTTPSAKRQRPDGERPVIRQLDDAAINRIAAGEVVERPASAVKELVENALDAGARRISVDYADGGKTLIRVTDDGCGMTAEDLPLALSRHATSKIDGSDLLDIHSFGFRGEALPSLGAVGRLSITSRARGHEAVQISVSGGRMEPCRPAALSAGTVVELRDLFFATPARLKFMRTDRAEAQAIGEIIKRLALAEPSVGFTLRDVSGGGEGRVLFRADPEQGDFFDSLSRRLGQVLGRDFIDNAFRVDASRDGLHLVGYAGLPTYSRGSSVAQYLFVNGRPVQDRQLIGALRAAYMDVLSRDRHPAVVLNLRCDPHEVDVNVHPAKSEVRFRDPASARGLLITALRHGLAEAGHRASSTVGAETLASFRPGEAPSPAAPRIYQMDRPSLGARTASLAFQRPQDFVPAPPVGHGYDLQEDAARFEPAPTPPVMRDFGFADQPSARVEAPPAAEPQGSNFPLGAARAQLHENYIIAQTRDGVVIVDQHAAHERLVYERLKAARAEGRVPSQALLIPDIIDLSASEAGLLTDLAPDLAELGLVIEPFGGTAIAVRETPALLGRLDARALIRDILDDLADLGSSERLRAQIDAVLSRMSCHGSIRSGRQMRAEEMNALLREMEATPLSGQCNHGRPTWVELKLTDIEKLFGRR